MALFRLALLCALAAMVTGAGTGLTKALQKHIVNFHNSERRAVHGADVMQIHWSSSLAQAAANWISHCQWQHEPGQKTGENLAEVKGGHATAASMVESGLKMWSNEKSHWHYSTDITSAGHYTQMIWAHTTQVGCAVHKCPNNVMMMSCKYSPPGNVGGQKPYVKGNVCSKCPSGKHCHNGLCA